ncbi:MAG: hypothetical protein ABI572_00740 [Actinomycetota bacterium]
MRTPRHAALSRPPETRRVFCAMCEHTEFVHGDIEARRCLYSECGCAGFTAVLHRLGTLTSLA